MSLEGLQERIRDAAEQMRDALLAGDWIAVGEIMRRAYPNRKRLAPNITTPYMDKLVEKALANGAEAAAGDGLPRQARVQHPVSEDAALEVYITHVIEH